VQSSKVKQEDWARLGLWHARPKYSDRVYISDKCTPLRGEAKLFHYMIRRKPVTVRDAVAMNAKAKDSFLRSDKNMEQYIRVGGTDCIETHFNPKTWSQKVFPLKTNSFWYSNFFTQRLGWI
jgi:hypothetical protein